jgi:excisionase family DNA binding protein
MVRMRVQDLKTHPEPYITVAELATYWLVGRKYIYKLIETGRLRAIRLGPRLLRIRTTEAIQFERRSITSLLQRTRSKSAAPRRRR